MMPFSSNDEDIDFVYGVINWKEVANEWRDVGIEIETDQATKAGPADIRSIWDTALDVEDETDEDEDDALELTLDHQVVADADASLDDCLAAARSAAAAANASEGAHAPRALSRDRSGACVRARRAQPPAGLWRRSWRTPVSSPSRAAR